MDRTPLFRDTFWNHRSVLHLSVLACMLAVSGPAAADGPAPAAEGAAKKDDLAAKRTEVASQIARLVAQEESTAEKSTDEADVSDAEEELEALRSLDSVYLQQQAAIEQRGELEAEKKRLAEELDAFQKFGPKEAKPYSFLLLENLRDLLSAEEDREASTQSDLRAAEQLLEAARERFDEAESERRQTHEATTENEEPDRAAELAARLYTAELDSRIAQETVTLRRVEIEVKTLRRELCQTRRTLLSEKTERIAKDVHFTPRDLQDGIQDLTRYASELKRKLKLAETELQKLEARQAAATQRLKEAQADQAAQDAEQSAWQTARRSLHEEISLVNQRMTEVGSFKHYWNCRYEVIRGTATKEETESWRNDLGEFLDQLRESERSLSLRIEGLRVDQATLFRRTHSTEREDIQRSVKLESAQLDRLVELCETSLLQLKSYQRSAERFLEELDNKIEPDKSHRWLHAATEMFSSAWNYELASVEDRPITVSKVFTGLCYVLLGLVAARLISRLFGARILPRFGLDEGAAHAVQAIMFYTLCVVFSMLSLELVNLPFAAFTFLGGAAAIGIGFGSQNIVSNFISGLILLAEQPIRVGDLVMIDGVQGTVERIGARSTRVRTAANYELIVPNSTLLENKVTNLTLSDDLVQTGISVTVPLKLTVDAARQTLMHAAVSHPKVLRDPGPVVLFKEVSATTMSFELHFWMQVRTSMETKIVESDIRESLNDLFASAGAAATSIGPTRSSAGKFDLPSAANLSRAA